MKRFDIHNVEFRLLEVLCISTIVGLLAAMAIPTVVDAGGSMTASGAPKTTTPAVPQPVALSQECAVSAKVSMTSSCPANAPVALEYVSSVAAVPDADHWVAARFASSAPSGLSF